ncbi:MAG: phosphoribosylformylglycinamidine synthase [Clostridia bacterium]|jgi:phosphoribosylformylglycinamidine synthase|nr:phosphoribosylformylglycinamidine synthase [Clostridia bacterium]
MNSNVRRIFVEKRREFATEANNLCLEIKENLNIESLQEVRVINRYDVQGLEADELLRAKDIVFSEPAVDLVYEETLPIDSTELAFAMEYLPGQYDQRADSAIQCIQILTQKERSLVKNAKVIVLKGEISDLEIEKVKNYCINLIDSREAEQSKPIMLNMEAIEAKEVAVVLDFIVMNEEELRMLAAEMSLAMTLEDLEFCQSYFKNIEKRNPSVTEIKVIDTYWSDHCRHTTFHTAIKDIQIEENTYTKPIREAFELYNQDRKTIYKDELREISLMDLATLAVKKLRANGKLQDLEVSDEINACSIVIDVDVNGVNEEWLLMFKNETHNHPTEIEPFGGAATCLGGAIRDPLSGRAYVFGAMRVTGSADPRAAIEETLQGKLPQRKITTGAAAGFSSYGNQIGLATGQVAEIYHANYAAKRMEIGAVLGATPRSNVRRVAPDAGDVIVLLGGRTGRDGCGGATGSSKEHDDSSIMSCGAEVQKGNPPTERKIQRLFRNPEVSRMIKKCNDFGAGGVAVAIGELADGLVINLDLVPKKYEGLDGTELAISESQERMAVVLDKQNSDDFMKYASEENLEAVKVAEVTGQNRLVMLWRNKAIVDISRDFLNTNGVKQNAEANVVGPSQQSYFKITKQEKTEGKSQKQAWLENLQDLNICSQRGLGERFDSTIGSGTVLMPYGGKNQQTPTDGLVMKIPVQDASTTTGAIMTYGFNPFISSWSPFHGAVYAVVEAVTKAAALGSDYRNIKLTLQEYFEKLGKDPLKWGKPMSALLGAYYAQERLEIAAIGGKDSMSGTFKDLNVPPTLVAFAVDTINIKHVISSEFKETDSMVVMLKINRDEAEMPDIDQLKKNLIKLNSITKENKVLSASIVKQGGAAAAISKMCFGNMIGMKFTENIKFEDLFSADYGNVIVEFNKSIDVNTLLQGLNYSVLGNTQQKPSIEINDIEIGLAEALTSWQKPLSKIFPSIINKDIIKDNEETSLYYSKKNIAAKNKIAKPKILIPVFPGTNCEYDTVEAFKNAGGEVNTLVIRNLTARDIEETIYELIKAIRSSQIIALPGGFSAGDEPDGSGKFIAAMFRNPMIKEEIMKLLKQRDGLMIGICNGFQALIKLGLVPYGEIRDLNENSPTLTHNSSGKHISCMANTQIISNLSPWFANTKPGDIHAIPVSHGEGRFIVKEDLYKKLLDNGQIATQYVDFNPNGSMYNVEGITSPDGRILGKMGHTERIDQSVAINIPRNKYQKLFEAGIKYFS